MRYVLALMMTYSLLACPFRCLGSIASEVNYANGEVNTRSCSCCQHVCSSTETERNSGEKDQPAPTNDCECQCLCKGGLQAEEVSFDLDFQSLAVDGGLWSTPTSVLLIADSATNITKIPDYSILNTGIEIRIRFDSLLI